MKDNSINKKFIYSAIIGLTFTLLSFYLHIHPSFNSMINFSTSIYNVEGAYFSDDYIQVVIDYHSNHPVFARRPLTTFFVNNVSSLFSLSIAKAFSLVNFLVLFLNGFVVYFISRALKFSHSKAVLSQVFYHLSFTILFPFFRTIYTYDEPFQYLFCLLSILAIIKNKQFLLITSLFLSLLARESSIVAFPSLFLLGYFMMNDKLKVNLNTIKKATPYIVSVALYMVFYVYHINTFEAGVEENYDELTTRVSQLSFNFQSTKYTIESIAVFFIVSLFPLTLLLVQPSDKRNKNFTRAFWLLLLLNTIMVYISARVCESRVLTMPLILLWPLMGTYFSDSIKDTIQHVKSLKNIIIFFVSIAATVVLSFYVSFELYKPTGSKTNENWFNEYFFIAIIVSGVIVIFSLLRKPNKSSINVLDE